MVIYESCSLSREAHSSLNKFIKFTRKTFDNTYPRWIYLYFIFGPPLSQLNTLAILSELDTQDKFWNIFLINYLHSFPTETEDRPISQFW
jgi:hypothetical protein